MKQATNSKRNGLETLGKESHHPAQQDWETATKHTCGYGGVGGKHRQQTLPLQVEEMLLLHLKELLLDGNLLGRQL